MAQYIYTMNRVGKVVPPKRIILRDISLSFFPGAKIGVLGLNGSGKSTLLKIMAGLDKEIEGEARPQPGIKIGYLPQEPQLDPEKNVRAVVTEGVADTQALIDRFNAISDKFAEPMDDEAMQKRLASLRMDPEARATGSQRRFLVAIAGGAAADTGVGEVGVLGGAVVPPDRDVRDLRHGPACLAREEALGAVVVQARHGEPAVARDAWGVARCDEAVRVAGVGDDQDAHVAGRQPIEGLALSGKDRPVVEDEVAALHALAARLAPDEERPLDVAEGGLGLARAALLQDVLAGHRAGLWAPGTELASVSVIDMDDSGQTVAAAAMAMMIFYTNVAARTVHAGLGGWRDRRPQAWRCG